MDRLGIDFGTSTTLAARREGPSLPSALRLGTTEVYLPSLAHPGAGLGRYLVGEAARDATPPGLLIRHAKSAITQKKYQLSDVNAGLSGAVEEVVIAIIQEAVDRVARATGHSKPLATSLSCPSRWDWSQRQRLLAAAEAAAIDTRGRQVLIDEPVAAGVGWAEWRFARGEFDTESRLLVVDVGGGTLDVALIDLHTKDDGQRDFKVLASWGDELGGAQVDQLLAEEIAGLIGRPDLAEIVRESAGSRTDEAELLLLACEETKKELSAADKTGFNLSSTLASSRATEVPASLLTAVTTEYIDSIERNVLASAKQGLLAHSHTTSHVLRMQWGELGITDVLIAGGGSRLRGIEDRFRTLLPDARFWTERTPYVSAEQMIVLGLASDSEYASISLDRPHFSVDVKINGNVERFYSAYDPLYTTALAVTNNRPALRKDFRVVGSGEVEVEFISVSGTTIRARGIDEMRWPLRHGTRDLYVTLYPNGGFVLSSNMEPIIELQLSHWNPFEPDTVDVVVRPPGFKYEPLGYPYDGYPG